MRTRPGLLPDKDVFAATRTLELEWLERKKAFKHAITTARRETEGWEMRSEYEQERSSLLQPEILTRISNARSRGHR